MLSIEQLRRAGIFWSIGPSTSSALSIHTGDLSKLRSDVTFTVLDFPVRIKIVFYDASFFLEFLLTFTLSLFFFFYQRLFLISFCVFICYLLLLYVTVIQLGYSNPSSCNLFSVCCYTVVVVVFGSLILQRYQNVHHGFSSWLLCLQFKSPLIFNLLLSFTSFISSQKSDYTRGVMKNEMVRKDSLKGNRFKNWVETCVK